MLHPPERPVTSAYAVCRKSHTAYAGPAPSWQRFVPALRTSKKVGENSKWVGANSRYENKKDERPKAQHHRGRRRGGTHEPGACLDRWAASSLPSRQEWHAHRLANGKAFDGGSAIDARSM